MVSYGEEDEQSLASRILAVYDNLPTAERQIADYLLEHRSLIADMTARDIAKASGSSAATMSRFVRTLGFSSYAQLRYMLAREKRLRRSVQDTGPDRISVNHLSDAINYVLSIKTDELKATASNLKKSDLGRVIKLIQQADLTLFAGVGNTISVAQNAAFKVTQTGHRAMAPLTDDGSALMAMALTERDVLVVLSTRGYSRRLTAVIENAHDSGATVVCICDHADSELAQRSDILLQTATHDRLLAEGLRFSHNPLNFVIEIITVLLYHGSADAPELMRLFDTSVFGADEPHQESASPAEDRKKQ